MSTLIYAPEVTVRIRTAAESRGKGRVIDVSEDVASGSVTRVRNGVSTANVTLLNLGRKYDGYFSPMDSVVVYLRRIRTVLKFTGYLDSVPHWAAEPGSINISASCTLKRFQHFLWDPGSPQAVELLSQVTPNYEQLSDGGLAEMAINVMNTVAGWPKEQIHIGRIPDNWYDKVSAVADTLIGEAEALQMAQAVGSGAWVGGSNPLSAGSDTIAGIGAGTGTMPSTSGKISKFGGPGGGAYGNMALTGESGVKPTDPWYCAMRWPYTQPGAVGGAKQWWVNRKILVVNPKTGKSLVLRAADWGPAENTGRVLDVSPAALRLLGAATDDTVNIAFAPQKANLGPVSAADAGLGTTIGPTTGSPTSASPVIGGWGNPGDEANIVKAQAAGCTFYVHRLAKTNFEGFVNDLVATFGYQPRSIGGFNDRNIAGTSSKSNHAWGAAIDIDPTINPRYGSSAGGTYALPHTGLIPLARKWGLGWGGEWRNSKDYMHFEVIGAPASDTYDGTGPGEGSTAVVVRKWTPPIHGSYTLGPRFGETSSHWASIHTGTDFQAPDGTDIYPVGPGVVHDKGTGDPSYGNHITIDHGAKNYTYYAHMNAPTTLAVGDQVTTDTVIGHVGSTGNATGPHVHVEYRRGADTYDAAKASGGIDKYVLGGKNRADPPTGTQAVQGTYDTQTPGVDLANLGQALFNVYQYNFSSTVSEGGSLLGGYRALINDQPIMDTIDPIVTSALREYCSAPNGDFIAWFPDYFGHYGQAGKMIVSAAEIDGVDGPPTVGWSDSALKTHMFVSSASSNGANDATEIWRQATTAGVASIEFPELMMALLNISRKEAETLRDTYLNRYGPRPDFRPMNVISGARQEFFFACHLFMQNWGNQYQAKINLTFMPELYPGMLLCLPDYGMQGYVIETTDSWDMTSGFTTSVSCAPWSSLGKNSVSSSTNLPIGAPL